MWLWQAGAPAFGEFKSGVMCTRSKPGRRRVVRAPAARRGRRRVLLLKTSDRHRAFIHADDVTPLVILGDVEVPMCEAAVIGHRAEFHPSRAIRIDRVAALQLFAADFAASAP